MHKAVVKSGGKGEEEEEEEEGEKEMHAEAEARPGRSAYVSRRVVTRLWACVSCTKYFHPSPSPSLIHRS